MDGVPWQVVVASVGALAGAIGWIGKRVWALVEVHVERRTQAVEAIAPAIDRFEERVIANFAEHARRQEQQIAEVEQRVVDAILDARDATIAAIALEDRIEAVVSGNGRDHDVPARHSRPDADTTLRGMPAISPQEADRTVASTRRGSRQRRGEQ